MATVAPAASPTSTPISSTVQPVATQPPPVIPSQTPAAQFLFQDDFETNIRGDWNRDPNKSSLVNGYLVVEGAVDLALTPDATAWQDYAVSFELGAKTRLSGLILDLRVENENRLIRMDCAAPDPEAALNCRWIKLVDGTPIPILGTEFQLPQVGPVKVEVRGSRYEVLERGLSFIEPTFPSGGIAFEAEGSQVWLGYFEVIPLAGETQ
jgi:hypothetical protein